MGVLPGIGGLLGASGKPTLYDVVTELGLTSNLLLCLDAGAAESYDGGQQWRDLSPNGAHFNLGTGNTADANDPAFFGAVGGLSENEYFQYGGSHFFSEVAAGWGDDDLHKANIGLSLFAVAYQPAASGYTNDFFANIAPGNSNRNVGVRVHASSIDPSVNYQTGNNSYGDVEKSTLADAAGMNFYGVSGMWASGGQISGDFTVNSQQDVKSYASGVSPSTSAASAAARIGGLTGGTLATAGTRIYGLALWRTRMVSQANMLAIRSRLKEARFPSLP